MRILHLLETLAPSESTWHIFANAAEVAQAGDVCNVCCLGRETDSAAILREAGVDVHTLGWSRWFDPRVFWKLRRHLDETKPDVIHVWSVSVLRMLAIVNWQRLTQVVFSSAGEEQKTLPWLDQRLTDAVGQSSPTYETVADDAPAAVRLAITERGDATAAAEVMRSHRIVCAGWNDRHAGYRYALWAFDFLRYHYPNLQLELVGVEDKSGVLQRLAVGLELTKRVTFRPPTLQMSEALSAADVVWLPSVADCGSEIAREALRLGKPIVASDVPSLRQTLRGGSLGGLISVGDVTALTRATHHLLRDPELRAHFAKAGQQHINPICSNWKFAYQRIAGTFSCPPLAA